MFASVVKKYLYGFSSDTVTSLLLTVFPPVGWIYKPYPFDGTLNSDECQLPINELLLKVIVNAMHLCAGFNVDEVSYITQH